MSPLADATCDVVSHDGFDCKRAPNHTTTHWSRSDVIWSDIEQGAALACRAVTDEPGPLPSMRNERRGHDGAHLSTEHKRVLHAWEGQ